MRSVGIFEAKTRLASICDEVWRSGAPVLIQRRGRPLVVIAPVNQPDHSGREDIYTAWRAWEEEADLPEFPDVLGMRSDSKAPVFEQE